MADEFCPRCQRTRTGFLQYCRGCGFDFDAPEPIGLDPPIEAITHPTAITRESPTRKPPISRRRIGRYAVIATAAVLGLSALSNVLSPAAEVASSPEPTVAAPSEAAAATRPNATPTPIAEPTAEATFGPTGVTQIGTVTRIVDGDTIRVRIDGVEFPVRYIGMDTPEPDATELLVRQLAAEATAANVALVEGREVILERDVSETDQFDRLLRDVWIQDAPGSFILVNLELIRQGFAQVSTYPPDVKYLDLLMKAQEAARAASLGLWAPAPTTAPTPTPLVATDDNCDSSYPEVCIPSYPPDLDCGEITYRRFTVRGPDPHGFDRNNDGIGCESG